MASPTTETRHGESPRSVLTWAFNPFHYIAGGMALAVGLSLIIAAGLVGAFSHSHHDGVLDFHTGIPAPWWMFPCEGLIDWLALSAALLLAGWLTSRSRVRPIDVFGTQALARWPALLMSLVALAPAFQKASARILDLVRRQRTLEQGELRRSRHTGGGTRGDHRGRRMDGRTHVPGLRSVVQRERGQKGYSASSWLCWSPKLCRR